MAQIDKPNTHFNTVLYTGTGSALSVTGANFQPNMTWVKRRNSANGHLLQDSVRGATNVLFPDGTGAEVSGGTYFTSFDSDGFTVTNNVASGASGGTYASWNWLGGGTAVSNTDGSITSSVSANTTAGFSVVTYTGNATSSATVGHGLTSVPSMIIVKGRTNVDQWFVYHKGTSSTPQNNYIYLNLTNTLITGGALPWNNTSPDASLFTLGSDDGVNGSGINYVAYCFAEVKGYSKFGSYVGNGSADGTFVYTGFKPAFVIMKRTNVDDQWYMIDNKRSSINPTNQRLFANLALEETTSSQIDILSNGFKARESSATNNASGGTYIYMAFAENPLVGTNNIPTTAR